MRSIEPPFAKSEECHPDDPSIVRACPERSRMGEEGSRQSPQRRRFVKLLPKTLAFLAFIVCLPVSVLAQQPPAPTPPLPPGKPDLPPLPAPPTNRLSVQPAFSVVIDAAHGGPNTGARIAENLLEKDVTLALS